MIYLYIAIAFIIGVFVGWFFSYDIDELKNFISNFTYYYKQIRTMEKKEPSKIKDQRIAAAEQNLKSIREMLAAGHGRELKK